jgi:1-acyl-sn-glycerol-3-phosphate acyltransferase
LKAGKAVLIFPEGTRTPDGVIHPLMPGIVALLRRVDVPILPVGIAGAYQGWPARQPAPQFAPLLAPARHGIAVVVGKPIDASALKKLPPKEILKILHGKLQELFEQAERLRAKK